MMWTCTQRTSSRRAHAQDRREVASPSTCTSISGIQYKLQKPAVVQRCFVVFKLKYKVISNDWVKTKPCANFNCDMCPHLGIWKVPIKYCVAMSESKMGFAIYVYVNWPPPVPPLCLVVNKIPVLARIHHFALPQTSLKKYYECRVRVGKMSAVLWEMCMKGLVLPSILSKLLLQGYTAKSNESPNVWDSYIKPHWEMEGNKSGLLFKLLFPKVDRYDRRCRYQRKTCFPPLIDTHIVGSLTVTLSSQ